MIEIFFIYIISFILYRAFKFYKKLTTKDFSIAFQPLSNDQREALWLAKGGRKKHQEYHENLQNKLNNIN